MLVLFITSYRRHLTVFPLGRAFGKQRFPKGWLFSCGRLLMTAFLLWIISCLEVALWRIGIACVAAVGNLWIISLFIVLQYTLYGSLCFKLSVFSGSCLALEGLLLCWSYRLGKHNSDIWNLIPGFLMWTIWLERNRRCFEDSETTLVELKDLCRRRLFDWSWCWGFTDCSSSTIFFFSQTRLLIPSVLFTVYAFLCSLS